jgi:DNA-binding XRE family transcriptional regulator
MTISQVINQVTSVTYLSDATLIMVALMHINKADIIILSLARQLASLRKKLGLSHEVLAAKAGVTRTAVSFIESGKRRPTLLILLKLVHAMDAELSTLLRKAERSVK